MEARHEIKVLSTRCHPARHRRLSLLRHRGRFRPFLLSDWGTERGSGRRLHDGLSWSENFTLTGRTKYLLLFVHSELLKLLLCQLDLEALFFLGLQYLVKANFPNTSLSTQCAVRRLNLSLKSYNLLFFVQGNV